MVAEEPSEHVGCLRVRGELLIGCIAVGGDQHPPEFRDAQQDQPFLGVGDVVYIGKVGDEVLDRELCRDAEEFLLIGEAIELGADQPAHDRSRSVGSDQKLGCDLDDLPILLDLGDDLVAIITRIDQRCVEEQLDIGVLGQPVGEHARHVELLALEPERVSGSIGNFAQVELKPFSALPVAPLIDGRLEPLGDERLGSADLVEHLERGCVEGRGAQIMRAGRLLLAQHHRQSLRSQSRGAHRPDGAGPYHQHFDSTHLWVTHLLSITSPHWHLAIRFSQSLAAFVHLMKPLQRAFLCA